MRLGIITRAIALPFLMLAIDGERKANAIIIPNTGVLVSPDSGKPKDRPQEDKNNDLDRKSTRLNSSH